MPQLDTTHNYMNGPAYFNQPPMNAVRHEFMPEINKLDNMPWGDNSAPRQMAELQEKHHVSYFV